MVGRRVRDTMLCMVLEQEGRGGAGSHEQVPNLPRALVRLSQYMRELENSRHTCIQYTARCLPAPCASYCHSLTQTSGILDGCQALLISRSDPDACTSDRPNERTELVGSRLQPGLQRSATPLRCHRSRGAVVVALPSSSLAIRFASSVHLHDPAQRLQEVFESALQH